MRPPQHSINAVPVYVMKEDPAWDFDRINRERAEMEPSERHLHPFEQYGAGNTRYDLNARVTWPGGDNSASDYLLGDPVRFNIRRLSVEQFAEVQDAFNREIDREGENSSFTAVWTKAARFGIKSIVGDPDLEFAGGRVTGDVMQAIFDKHGGILSLASIGLAVWVLSKPLNEAEKKL